MQDPVTSTRSPTPTSYALAVSELTTSQINAEILRLAVSEVKLQETNKTLSTAEWKQETFALEAVRENEELLSSYAWRRALIQEELEKRGVSGHGTTGSQVAEGIEL